MRRKVRDKMIEKTKTSEKSEETPKEKPEKKYSINSAQTDFPMKANSAVRELEIQAKWDSEKVYERSLKKRFDCPKFVLHDGPPYLSSPRIHIGTALNKILKDIITKYKSIQGFYSPYVPGYDSHGLPIETAVVKDVKGGRQALTPIELRKRCREFALTNLKGQTADFKRLGVWGDWDHPYITLDNKFEASQLRVFGQMAEAGYLYKGLKSVSWCPNCETALAEAEVEYADHLSQAIYVGMLLDKESKAKLPSFARDQAEVSAVIWTTTTWTMPANVAVAVNAEFEYEFLKTATFGTLIVAKVLRDSFLADVGIEANAVESLGTMTGAQLEHLSARHPFFDRPSPIILGDHVTSEAGTGMVHTAPGHGPEDFALAAKYKLPVISPVDGRGIFTKEAGPFEGMRFNKAVEPIIELLKQKGALIHHGKLTHSYPHCWRCKNPLIFRATEQWFASLESFRDKALLAIDQVEWVPAAGRNRIYSMVEGRSEWCISRQRAWGMPIPAFYCASCGKVLLSSKSVEKVASIFEKEGSDSWWEKDAEYFLDSDTKCKSCGHGNFTKETDIMDVWFDSGTTHAGVIDQRPELRGTPCELYLEGSDQHRGWFQSSLLTSVATKGRAPYKTVLTHGYVVDEQGRKLSKSSGNAVAPETIIKEYGADVLRLWVASINYTDDVPIGKIILAQLAEVYRKLRNTERFILGNLFDFDPAQDTVSFAELKDIDKFVLHKLSEVLEEVIGDFDRYEFFKFYQILQNFCVVDLSSFYFDIAKDRLYTAGKKSHSRRAVQTVLAELLRITVHLLVPVTPHLAEDIWRYVPEKIKEAWQCQSSVLLEKLPELPKHYLDQERAAYWRDMISVRSVVNKALEQARAAGKIGSPLEAQVFVYIEDPNLRSKAQKLGLELAPLFITSQATVEDKKSDSGSVLSELDEDGLYVRVLPADGTKCERCWKFSLMVGKDKEHPTLCDQCIVAITEDHS